jgi:methylated-DNA-[protein]-cysteine S-methyltransferase
LPGPDGTLRWKSQLKEPIFSAPCGDTISYSTLAQKIGRRDAARAVGQAVGANPVVILIPCHRVIRADGSPGDYARGTLPLERGRQIKNRLLDIEGAAQ